MSLDDRTDPFAGRITPQERLGAEIQALIDAFATDAAQKQAEAVAAARAAAAEEADQRWRETRAQDEARWRQQLDEREAQQQQAVAEAEQRAEAQLREAASTAEADARTHREAHTRVLAGVRELDGARSLSEVLDALSQTVARECARSAVFTMRGDRLQSWRITGFGELDLLPRRSIEVPLDEAGPIREAVQARQAQVSEAVEVFTADPFVSAMESTRNLSMPLLVGGQCVAVVHGGAAPDEHAASVWPEVVELLSRHAARCLEALTVQNGGTQGRRPRTVAPAFNSGMQPASLVAASGSA